MKQRKPKKTARDRVADFASLDFKPWETGRAMPPTNEEWCGMVGQLATVRAAYAIMTKSKADLVEMWRKIEKAGDQDVFMKLEHSMADVEEFHKALSDLLASARSRLLIGASAYAIEQEHAAAEAA